MNRAFVSPTKLEGAGCILVRLDNLKRGGFQLTMQMVWGFLGDTLSFIGAFLLALDALLREREFRKERQVSKMIKSLAGIRVTLHGIELVDEDSASLAFIRQSVARSIWGSATLTAGFICLLITRFMETIDHIKMLHSR